MGENALLVAAVQMQAEMGNVAANFSKAEALARQAFGQGAEWVILPEFFTSAMAFHPKMLDAARPLKGEPLLVLRDLARQYSGVVGGSFIAMRGENAYNTFALAFPDGSVFFHDKDQPTMWENCYYIGGNDDGVLNTPAGPVGAALCWEMIRSRTARRLMGRVGMIVGGSCWWDLPDDILPQREPLRARNLSLVRETPARLAKMIGVPIVHASHCGAFEGFALRQDQTPYRSYYLGETQIVDGHGVVLARMSKDDGEGVIIAEVHQGRTVDKTDPVPDGFWTAELWEALLRAWERENRLGQEYYRHTALPHYRTRSNGSEIQG